MLKRTTAVAVLLVGVLLARGDVGVAQSAQDGARAAKTDRLTLDLYLDMETVSEPQLSPDGSQIVYTRGWIDKVNDKRESALWIMNSDGSRNRFLAKGSGARWSPSGDRIAYTTQGEPKGAQIFVRWMDAEGATSQITRVEQAPSAVAWSPDGKQLSFSMLVEERNNWPIKMPKAPAGAKWTEAPRIVEQLNYRRDRSGFTDNGYRHVFVVPASGGTPRQITSGNFDHAGTDWTPDGRSILFSGLRSENASYQWRESEIYAVDVADGAIRQLTKRKGPDGNPTVSPDGKRVAYTGYDWTTDTWVDSKIYLMNIDGTNPRLVSGDWDRAPAELRWSADGSGLYFTAQNEGSQNLYYLPVSTPGKVTAITKGTQMLTVSDISPKGIAVGTLTTSLQPGDIVDLRSQDAGVDQTADRGQRGHPRRSQAGRSQGALVHLAGRDEDSRLVHHTARFRSVPQVPDAAPHSRWAAQHVRRRIQLRLAGARGQRLRHPLHESARQHRLRQRIWQRHQERVSEQGLRRPHGRSRRAAREGIRRSAEPLRDRLQRRRRPHRVDRRPHGSLRGRVRQLPGDRLAQLRRHDRRRELVLQLRQAPVGRPDRAHQALAAHLRRQRQDADDAHDRRERSADPDAADRAVLQRPQAAQRADGHDQIQRRVARNDEHAVELRRTQLYLRYWFDKYKRGAEKKTTTPSSESR